MSELPNLEKIFNIKINLQEIIERILKNLEGDEEVGAEVDFMCGLLIASLMQFIHPDKRLHYMQHWQKKIADLYNFIDDCDCPYCQKVENHE